MARYGMLIDLTRCIGCDACTVACKQENGTPVDVFFARVYNVEIGRFPNVKRVYLPTLCNHCENAACLKACPNKAIFRREDGIVLIDQDRCRGTGACVPACPYGNVYLLQQDRWYLGEDIAYEQDVKSRLRTNVARKCTYCAHRVDVGLDPACVVACPTTARIFGDLDDAESPISTYIAQEREQSRRTPFHLLEEAGTQPVTSYLAPLNNPTPCITDPRPRGTQPYKGPRYATAGVAVVALIAILVAFLALKGNAQEGAAPMSETPRISAAERERLGEVWSGSACVACHGATGMGALGPPLAETKLKYDKFEVVVRKGRGMMPAVKEGDLPDNELRDLYSYARITKLDPSQIPLSFKIGSLLTVNNTIIGLGAVGVLSLILCLIVLGGWMRQAGLPELWPDIARFGFGRALWTFVVALIVDGFCVASLFRDNKLRWFVHGMMLYGFVGLMAMDIITQIVNPTRGFMPLWSPLKIAANLFGLTLVVGLVVVKFRVRHDPYEDNGLTKGQDFLFIDLLIAVLVTGFLTEATRYLAWGQWVLPVYVTHLAFVAALLLTAPFSRLSHVFVVPALVGVRRITEEIVKSGINPQFAAEPSPGRHHKGRRIVNDLVKQIYPGEDVPALRIRYYP